MTREPSGPIVVVETIVEALWFSERLERGPWEQLNRAANVLLEHTGPEAARDAQIAFSAYQDAIGVDRTPLFSGTTYPSWNPSDHTKLVMRSYVEHARAAYHQGERIVHDG